MKYCAGRSGACYQHWLCFLVVDCKGQSILRFLKYIKQLCAKYEMVPPFEKRGILAQSKPLDGNEIAVSPSRWC